MRERWSKSSVATLAIGMLFGAPSLAYPFGSDQGLFWYIGRAWLLHGAVPYRDTFDIKPPPIYLLHGLASLVSGGGMWGIRLFEWLAMIPLGFAAASIASPAEERTPKMHLALGVLAANLVYFGFFDFWDSAQCELWCSLATIGALWVVLRTRLSLARAAAIAGALGGIAVLMKPPSAFLVLVVAVALVVKHRATPRRAAIAVVVFGAASLVPLLVAILYFAKVGALADMIDIVVNYNREYVRNDNAALEGETFSTHLHYDLEHFGAWWVVVPLAMIYGIARGSRDRWILAAALLLAAGAAIALQGKYYRYHYGVILPGHVLAVVLAMRDGAHRIPVRERWREAIAVAMVILLFAMCARAARRWRRTTGITLAYAFGQVDRETFATWFEVPWFQWTSWSRERVGIWLREHTDPNDTVLVRGFDATIYAAANRYYGGRFATTHHLTSTKVLYKRDEWLAQDRADIERIKPRIVVARVPPDWCCDVNDERWFTALGYRSVERMPPFVIMERR